MYYQARNCRSKWEIWSMDSEWDRYLSYRTNSIKKWWYRFARFPLSEIISKLFKISCSIFSPSFLDYSLFLFLMVWWFTLRSFRFLRNIYLHILILIWIILRQFLFIFYILAFSFSLLFFHDLSSKWVFLRYWEIPHYSDLEHIWHTNLPQWV